MEKIMNNKKLLIIIGIVIILLTIVIAIILIPKSTNEVTLKPFVEHGTVSELYDDLGNPECIENCDKREYVSKLYGYTYDENENIEMHVKEGYIENNKIYDLEGNELGDYTEDTLNTLLDNGTLKVYNYTKNDNEYILK